MVKNNSKVNKSIHMYADPVLSLLPEEFQLKQGYGYYGMMAHETFRKPKKGFSPNIINSPKRNCCVMRWLMSDVTLA